MMLVGYFLIAFILGSIPNAYLVARWLRGIDIRQHGSGNVGATNVFRVLGKGPGVAVFALDFAKAALPAIFFPVFFPGTVRPELMSLAAGMCAVVGHMFTPFLKFKGGKGVASGGGALLAAYPSLFLIALSTWLITFKASRIVSLSSLASAFALFIAALFLRPDTMERGAFAAIFLMVLWSHRSNIQRLLKNEEHHFSKSTK